MHLAPFDTSPRALAADRAISGNHPGGARRRRPERASRSRALARYTDSTGRDREIVTRAGYFGSVLLIDRDLASRSDHRLLAHLAADEPSENAALICREYLAARPDPRRCRLVTDEDAHTNPLTALGSPTQDGAALAVMPALRDSAGRAYALESVSGRASIPELRWRCHEGQGETAKIGTVSLREVVSTVEHYEPACAITESTLALRRGSGEVSISALEAELVRVRESPIVLNRRLREAVLVRIEQHGQSMSEIALRCGRVKRDRRGNESGETSWLARRIGLLAEGGQGAPTPWIHSDVLALIARQGLGVSPREVEVA